MINAYLNENPKMNISSLYDKEAPAKNAFAQYIRGIRKDYNEISKFNLSTRELGNVLGFEYDMFRKILNKNKPTKKRDFVIAVCYVLRITPGQVNEALMLYGFLPLLVRDNSGDSKYDPRDEYIEEQIRKNCDFSKQIDPRENYKRFKQDLVNCGFEELDIADRRKVKKELCVTNRYYNVVKKKINTPIEAAYYGDQYDSLSTEYSLLRYQCDGKMLLYDPMKAKYISLTLGGDGARFINDHSTGEVENYNSINPDSEFVGKLDEYYEELQDTVNIEKMRLYRFLNDTKNYQRRISANLVGDAICVFVEEYNYAIPEMDEYYLMTYSSGKYMLMVYDHSAFMYYYLPHDVYVSIYGKQVIRANETYKSTDQIEELEKKYSDMSDMGLLLKLRKLAFKKLKLVVDEMHTDLKERKCFINNLNHIEESVMIEYYKIKEDFQCAYNDAYGGWLPTLNEKTYLLDNGTEVKITYSEICRAYELGYVSIADICRIKANRGSVEAVL